MAQSNPIGLAAYRLLGSISERFPDTPWLSDWRRLAAAALIVSHEEGAPEPTPLLVELARAGLLIPHPSGSVGVAKADWAVIAFGDGTSASLPWPPASKYADDLIRARVRRLMASLV